MCSLPRLISAVLVLALVGCQSPSSNSPTNMDASNPTQKEALVPESQPARAVPAKEFVSGVNQAFKKGEGERFASHYAAYAKMSLSSGVMFGHEMLSGAAKKAGPSVEAWTMSNLKEHEAKSGSYLLGDSLTLLDKGGQKVEIKGKRLLSLTKDASPKIQADLSIGPKMGPVPDAISAQVAAIAAASNKGDAMEQSTKFTPDALVILSDGRAFWGEQMMTMFQMSKQFNITDMVLTPKSSWEAGPEAVYVSSEYAFSMTLPSSTKPVTLMGCRVELWKQLDGVWKVALQVSQPQGSPACL